jgi:signal transduction histidine kinase
VQVRADVGDGMLRIRILDEGPGVAASDLDKIFQPFSRGTRSADRNGYGLGLAITRQAVEQQGGRVWAATPIDGGLEISVMLPRSAGQQPDRS